MLYQTSQCSESDIDLTDTLVYFTGAKSGRYEDTAGTPTNS